MRRTTSPACIRLAIWSSRATSNSPTRPVAESEPTIIRVAAATIPRRQAGRFSSARVSTITITMNGAIVFLWMK